MNPHTLNDIISRWRGGQSMRSVAQVLGMSRGKVKRALEGHDSSRGRQTGSGQDVPPSSLTKPRRTRKTLLDPFEETIAHLLERYPDITVQRLLEELRGRGYEGGYTMLRLRVKELRGSPRKQLVQRFETAPGVQAQMDWATYTINFTVEGRRRVNLFSYVLGYSRRQYLRFTDSQDFTTLVREHVRAFEHLDGAAAECLYDNMKTVVDRWEDDQPIYNTRFLAFATHYGFRPRACRPARPQTKGKVERPFYYVEKNLLNGRTFQSLEHLNEVTATWLSGTADARKLRETGKTPTEAHAEEQSHLLPLPAQAYDTARVLYRVVDVEGFLSYERNQYSVPWRLVGQMLPVRMTEHELIAYDRRLGEIARHELFAAGVKGHKREEPKHRPSRDRREELEELRARFAELGEVASGFLEGLLQTQTYGKHQARKVLAHLSLYHQADVLAAMERAVRYRAFSCAALERILAVAAKPKSTPQSLAGCYEAPLLDDDPVEPRPTSDYQPLLFPENADGQDQSQAAEEDDYEEDKHSSSAPDDEDDTRRSS